MESVVLFGDQESLKCEDCGKDLFENPEMSIVVFNSSLELKQISDIYACCKGKCDESLKKGKMQDKHVDGWKDLKDFMNPILYLKQLMAMLNKMHRGTVLTDEAIEEYKHILLCVAPYVMRQPTDKEKELALQDEMYSI